MIELKCAVNGCVGKYRSRGYCRPHYDRLVKAGMIKPLTLEERFWTKVNKTDYCWLWTSCSIRGYGRFFLSGSTQVAHRVSWEIHNGEIPDGLCVLHKCDVRNCVNPSHLFLGTNQDNVDDKVAKGRQLKGEATGRAKLTDEKVVEIRNKHAVDGVAQCRLAAMYNVTQATIFAVINRKTWAHV